MILITGGTGFVGQRIVDRLDDQKLVLMGRNKPENPRHIFFESEISPSANYSEALNSVAVVIHCAARAHVMNDSESDPLSVYRSVNTEGTLNLARQAAEAGVKRFIFISSIKVNGEHTETGEAFKFNDSRNPQDPYGVSKAEAEERLVELSEDTGMEVVIIRPPLVYGPGVKANFASMMNLARKNLPLPLGAINNKRSIVGIDNLVDLVLTCIDHPRAANETFLVSDDHDVSTTELLQALTRAAGKRPWLLPVPMKLIKSLASLIGKKAIADRLCGNLQVDITHTKDTLSWVPPISFEDGIARCFDQAN